MEINKIILRGQITQTEEVREGSGKRGQFLIQNVILQFQNAEWLNKARITLFDSMIGSVKLGDQVEVHLGCDLKPSKNIDGVLYNVFVAYKLKNLTTGRYAVKTANKTKLINNND